MIKITVCIFKIEFITSQVYFVVPDSHFQVNFDNIEARSAVERRRIEERQHRRQLAEQQKVITILQKMQGMLL